MCSYKSCRASTNFQSCRMIIFYIFFALINILNFLIFKKNLSFEDIQRQFSVFTRKTYRIICNYADTSGFLRLELLPMDSIIACMDNSDAHRGSPPWGFASNPPLDMVQMLTEACVHISFGAVAKKHYSAFTNRFVVFNSTNSYGSIIFIHTHSHSLTHTHLNDNPSW